ncbi:MAG: OmpA family protein [Gemmobacter sp.]
MASRLAFSTLLCGAALPCAAADLLPPSDAAIVLSRSLGEAPHALPVGPWDGTGVPAREVAGPIREEVWQIAHDGQSATQLAEPLRATLEGAGFEILLDCTARSCGGFDFRFAVHVAPQPEMRVDLGDFRFISAVRGEGKQAEAVSILASRSSTTGFVQIVRSGGPETGRILASSKAMEDARSGPPEAGEAVETAMRAGSLVLDDLVFAAGAAELRPGDYPALAEIADWLRADPLRRASLVGHSDASGGHEINLDLSRRRAEAVRRWLIDMHAVAPAQLVAEGVGYLAPRASNLTEEGRARNRRVEVILSPVQ